MNVLDVIGTQASMALSDGRASCAAELEQARAAVAELIEAHRNLLAMAERLDLAEGVCCCGDDMSRLDAGHYHHGGTIQESRDALARVGGAK